MKYLKIFTLIIASWLFPANLIAQDGVSIGNWRTHLPYQKVIKVEPVDNKIYAATEFELFYYDTQDNSVNILNKINGLSDIGISTMRYNQSQRKLFVAYSNANIDLIDHNGNIKNMNEIKNKNIVGNKRINNVFFDGDLAYVACGFGIVVFDMKKEEVKDTYYIGNQGEMVNVTDVAIYNGRIYASTDDGIYYASQDAPNLANFAAWHFDSSLIHPHLAYTEMEVFSGRLFLNYDGGYKADTLFVLNGNQWNYFDKEDVNEKFELRAYNDNFIISNRYSVDVYDRSLTQILHIYSPGHSNIEPLSSAIDNNGNFWIGDTDRGLIKSDNGWNGMDVKPNGPYSKNVFELKSCGDQVWIATGGHRSNWSNSYMKEGVARFDGSWTTFNDKTVSDLESISDYICTATDPLDPSVTYVGTWGSGLLKFKDNELVEIYNADNSTLDYWVNDPNLINISGVAFDSKGNLWVANTGATNLLSVMERNGTWHSYNLSGSFSGIDIGPLFIDKNDYKWIIRRSGDLLVFNDGGTLTNSSDDRTMNLNTSVGNGNLLGSVNCLALDANGAVWVGTDKGPCYFTDTRLIFNGSGFDATQKRVPRNDGTDQWDYLFDGANVLSMAALSGTNQMWFGLESGVYLMSFEKQVEEIHNFTTDNSPLLDDAVTAIAIDKSGEVFFGTANGVISYRGKAATPEPYISDVVAYPNPVRPGYTGFVGIKGLVSNSLVRITTVDGSFVTQLISEGGQAVWDLTNINGERVSPGVYYIFVSTKQGTDKFATKILIQN